MKSIIQEASSIAKAIDQGWQIAGKPQEFSVKILEHPEKNFFGLTTRSAKVAIVFNIAHVPQPADAYKQKSTKKKAPQGTKEKRHQEPRAKKAPAPHRSEHNKPQEPSPEPDKPKQQKQRGLWNEDFVASAREWFEKTLTHMGHTKISFTIEPQNYYLRITLNKPILTDANNEKHLLASLSNLLMATLKRKFKKPLRGHKIVLTHDAE